MTDNNLNITKPAFQAMEKLRAFAENNVLNAAAPNYARNYNENDQKFNLTEELPMTGELDPITV